MINVKLTCAKLNLQKEIELRELPNQGHLIIVDKETYRVLSVIHHDGIIEVFAEPNKK